MLQQLAHGLVQTLTQRPLAQREADITAASAHALGRQVNNALAFATDYHHEVPGRTNTTQHVGHFNTYDLAALDPALDPLHLFGVKYGREEKTGILWQFDLLIFDLLAVGLEKQHQIELGTRPDTYGLIVYVTNDFYNRRGPQQELSPFADFFPHSANPRRDVITLQPSHAAPNPGQGRTTTWPSYRQATTVTRSHLSTAVTGGLNSKLTGYFLRPAFDLVLEYSAVTLPHQLNGETVGYVTCMSIDSLSIAADGHQLYSLDDVLQFIP